MIKTRLFTIVTLLLGIASMSYAQDSILIHYNSPDRYNAIINDLNNIQYISIVCKDVHAHDKKFRFVIDEYREGKLILSDTTALKCEEELIPMEVNGRMVNYRFSLCDKKMFTPGDSIFQIDIAGKLTDRALKLLIRYPQIQEQKELKGDADYSLRTISCDHNEKQQILVGKLTPVLAYCPPFDTGHGMNSYCILGSENTADWYKKFKIKHYYVISLVVQ